MRKYLENSQRNIAKVLEDNIENCPKRYILLFVSLAYNISSGRVPLTRVELKKLRPYKNFILRLGCCQSTICEKKALIKAYKRRAKEAIVLMNNIILSK